MTTLLPHAALPHARTAGAAGVVVALALTAGVSVAAAQQPQPAPTLPQPAVSQAPALQRPPSPPPPPAPVTPAARAAGRAPVFPAVRPAARAGLPPDSVRPRAAALEATPANWVARCRDGAYVVPPSTAAACGAHGGVLVTVVRPAAPPAASRAAPAPAAMLAPQPASGSPPPGATMRCKDGTYLTGTPAPGRCDAHGSAAATLPAARPAPAPPSRPRRP